MYKICCLKKVKEQALFVEIREKSVSNNFRPVIRAIREKNEKSEKQKCCIQYFYLQLGRVSEIKYLINCFRMMPVLASSKYLFVNESSNVISALPLRKETKMIQTWHACGALKKFGYSTGTKEVYYGNEDIVTVSDKHIIPFYAEAMGLSEEVFCPIGVPRTDIFFQKSFLEKCETKKQLLKDKVKGGNKKILLYAPTFRGNVAKAKRPDFDYERLQEAVKDEFILLVKEHNALASESEYTIEQCLVMADVLITDYSSLIYEYSLLGKKAIFYAYDLSEYEKDRGFFIDYEKEIPGPIVKNMEELIFEVKNPYFDVEKMKQFKEKYMSACDGQATKRLMKLLENW